MARALLVAAIGLVLANIARATPMVTYTLSLNESPTGTVSAGQFAIYATVSQGDNRGLFAMGVDLLGSGEAGGPVGLTVVNRIPGGVFNIDPTDPNYDPGAFYLSQGIGFITGRTTNAVTGVISGIQYTFPRDPELPIFAAGQLSQDINDLRPPPNTSNGLPVRYGSYVPYAGTDNPIGSPFNHEGAMVLPAGSMRIATGTYDAGGALPTFQIGAVNNKAAVYKAGTEGFENEPALLTYCLRDFAGGEAFEMPAGGPCVIPEPGMAGAIIGLALMVRRRR